MDLISLIVTLVVVGIALWCVNTFLAAYMDAKVLQLLNVVIIIVLILWLLQAFGVLGRLRSVQVGHLDPPARMVVEAGDGLLD